MLPPFIDPDSRADVRTWLSNDDRTNGNRDAFPEIHQTFQEALDRLTAEIAKGAKSVDLTSSASSIQGIHDTVRAALAKYSGGRKNSKVGRWLNTVMPSVSHYSKVMNLLGQQHPEYLALMWGVMKVVFDAVQYNEATICLLSEALSEVANTLPQVELSAVLYRTPMMRCAVGDLYVKLLRFFMRAYEWCHESSFRHFLRSLTQPPELRYQDLLQDISASSRQIHQLAESISRIELREIHYLASQVDQRFQRMDTKVDNITSLVTDLRSDIIARLVSVESLISSSHLDTNRRLDDIQLQQSISALSDSNLGDPLQALRFNQWLQRNRGKGAAPMMKTVNKFWQSPKLQSWTSASESSVAAVTGDLRAQAAMRKFALNVIDDLQSNNVCTLWALQPPGVNAKTSGVSVVDLMKHLVAQALRFQQERVTERDMTHNYARMRSLATEKEWFQLLGSILAQARCQVYIVVDLFILDRRLLPRGGVSWFAEFGELFAQLRGTAPSFQAKVLLLGGMSALGADAASSQASNMVVPVKVEPIPVRRRKQTLQLRGSKR